MPRLSSTKKKIQSNHKVFESLKERAFLADDETQKIHFFEKAARWASENHSGLFACPEIEAELCRIAQNHPTLLTADAQKHSVLHVMTTGYKTGGHTRVVEKWVKYRPEKTKHDVVFINQFADDVPEFLQKTLAEEGLQEIHLAKGTPLEKALELRKLAMNYEQVVLHTHMHDPVPLLAFGTEDFKRPVIYYNHADHIFWLGVSIADLIVDLTPAGQHFTRTRRGSEKSTVLPVPISAEQFTKLPPQKTARRDLGLPQEQKIMLSIGGSWRFAPSGKFNFPQYCIELLEQHPDLTIIIVGVPEDDKHWKKATKKFSSERLKLTGRIFDKQEYANYVASADFYVEALPAGAEITTLEVGLSGRPVYLLNQPAIRAEVFDLLYAQDLSELKEMVNKQLETRAPPKAQKAFSRQVAKVHSEEAFGQNIKRIHKQVPTGHKVEPAFVAPHVVTSYDIYLFEVMKGMHKDTFVKRFIGKARKRLAVKASLSAKHNK